MNRTRVATLATTAAVGTALVVGTATASAHQRTTTHTLTFRAHQISSAQVGSNGDLEAHRDVRNGHTIGYDAISCHFDFQTKTAHCRVALALVNGTMAGRFTLDANSGAVQGTIVSGTGAYAGVTGSISGHPGSTAKDAIITLRYHK
jgi:hypothetical protein